jgi:peptidoglycan/LPS O-acetylase OafA/YrhL
VLVCIVWRLAWYASDPFWQRFGAGGQGLKQAPVAALATLYWLPTHFDLFALGMGLALVSAWAARQPTVPRLIVRIGRMPGLWWGLAGFTYWVVSSRVGLPRDLTLLTGGQYFMRQTLYGLMALFLLMPAVFGDQRVGAIRRFLCWGPIAFAGLVSYGIYLWHQAWIGQVREDWLGQRQLFRGPVIVVIVVAFGYTIATATLSYYLIERPLLRFKDRPPWRRATAATPAVTS